MKRLAVLVIFLILGIGIYFNSLRNGFHYDDIHHFSRNSYIRTLSNIPLFFTEPRTFSVRSTLHQHYRPLVMASYAVNYYLGGFEHPGYHLFNLAFHIGSAFLLFMILQAMLSPQLLFIPLAAGLFFLTTPFNSEVVNYITTRSTVMCSFFYLMAFYFWVKYRMVAPATYYYIASIFAFLLAMLTKEVAVTLPAMLFLYDLYFYRNPTPILSSSSSGSLDRGFKPWHILFRWRAYIIYIPFMLIGVFFGIILRVIYFGSFTTQEAESFTHLLLEIKVLAKYFAHMAIPINLSVEHFISRTLNIYFLLSLLLLISLWIMAYLLWRSRDLLWRTGSFFIIWFFIILLPTTVVALNTPYQENRGYTAAIGFAALIAVGMDKLGKKIIYSVNTQHLLGYILLGLLVATFSIGVVQRNQVWLNSGTLWSDVAKKYPQSTKAHIGLGNHYMNMEQWDQAKAEFQAALDINPRDTSAINNIGIIFLKKGELKEAEEFFKKSLDIYPLSDIANLYMGGILHMRGEPLQAARHFLHVLVIKPDNLFAATRLVEIYSEMGRLDEAYNRVAEAKERDPDNPAIRRALGLIYMMGGKWMNALREFEIVLRYMPGDPATLTDLANICLKQGLVDRAERIFTRALLTDPTNLTIYHSLGVIYHKRGRFDDALQMYQKVLTKNPKSVKILNNIGSIYSEKGEDDKAINVLRKALQIDPSYHLARINLANAYAKQGNNGLARGEYQRLLRSVPPDGEDKTIYLTAKEGLASMK